jgi:MSHA pilin protein MshD
MSTSRFRARGMTLVELVVAIVVIGVGLTGVLVAFNQAVRGSADPMIRKQMLAIAEAMMEEITLKPFAVGTAVPPVGCARGTHDDVHDYDGYTTAGAGVCTIDGTAIPSLVSYNVAVAVTAHAMPNGVTAANALRIEVTVTHGTETLTLIGYRTAWA